MIPRYQYLAKLDDSFHTIAREPNIGLGCDYVRTENPEGSDNIKITREHASGPQPVSPVPEKKRPPDRKKMAVSPSGGVEFSSRGDGNDNKHNTSEKKVLKPNSSCWKRG